MSRKIIFTTGGTGGHIFPTISVMQYFLKKGYVAKLVTDRRATKYLKDYSELNYHILNTDTPTNKKNYKKVISYLNIILSIFRSIFFLMKEKPELVFGFGGYVSFPVSIAAKILNIPLVIYENNMVIGRTNRHLLTFASRLLLASDEVINIPKKFSKKTRNVGHILRKNIIDYLPNQKEKTNDTFSVLVLGGSQGAEIFGLIIPEVIKKIHDTNFNIKIYHQCIKSHKDKLFNFYKKNNINSHVFEFTNDILNIIKKTDLAISRCGASSSAELVFTQTPFIAVPYPYAIDNHQYFNAQYHQKEGHCWLLEQKNFNNENLFNLIIKILKDKRQLTNMKENMKNNFFKLTNENIEKSVREIL